MAAHATIALADLRRSAEPVVVLSSLARLSVASFSDGCVVEISEGVEPLFRVEFPLEDDEPATRHGAAPGSGLLARLSPGRIVTTPFTLAREFGRPACAGRVIHRWRITAPGACETLIARLAVDHALAVVGYERLAQAAAEADARSARSSLEALTAHAIGQATGLLMASENLSEAAAARVLQSLSRESGRPLGEIALEVVRSRPSSDAARVAARAHRLRRSPTRAWAEQSSTAGSGKNRAAGDIDPGTSQGAKGRAGKAAERFGKLECVSPPLQRDS
jgi:hypothetical protein